MTEHAHLPARTRMLRCSVLAGLGAIVLMTSMGLASVNGTEASVPLKVQQQRFMWAMAGQESGGDYYARNRSSGAFGKYQIMPANWPNWARQYLGDSQADQTPYNQERVAWKKIRKLYRWLGSWDRVAYWWLTGKSDPDPRRWSQYSKGYVSNIMSNRKRAPRKAAPPPRRTSSYPGRGAWRRSGSSQKLYLAPAGKRWPPRGRINDGQTLKVRRNVATRSGVRWLQVVSADGRLGWLPQQRTVPARRPALARLFNDVDDRGKPLGRSDRLLVRPRPR